jgi:hypothetical protein
VVATNGAKHIIPAIPATGPIEFETAVAVCAPIGLQHGRDWLFICDVADRMHQPYGRGTLQKFAERSHLDYDTLRQRLALYRACKTAGVIWALTPKSWSLLLEFKAAPEYGAKYLKANPGTTQAAARLAMAEHKNKGGASPPPPQKEDWDIHQHAVLSEIMRAVKLINKHGNLMEAYGDDEPEKERALAAKVAAMTNLLKEGKAAAEKLPAMIDYLLALPAKYVEATAEQPKDEPEQPDDEPAEPERQPRRWSDDADYPEMPKGLRRTLPPPKQTGAAP